ncbi:hypothetical protein DAPPUDRAFT_307445 [Daphnia pulex]|uniref:Peptide deformylase n=1 Tax=Daphnia pulex TaxID=6669 RepID=E9H2A8_DAPPU|nr:hypothetical protein DAPPUDRAFT_307445 [Daphnia pulex]|eukprot:EFX74141.1 hypothetical protein DAPPUDRAFT_307445 [Daphnia pulex]
MFRYMKILNKNFSGPTSVRYLSSFEKFKRWYRDLWYPKGPAPPFKHVSQLGDPTLRLKSSEVVLDELSSERIKNILLVLRGVMKHYKAIGISAPQIGIPLRIIMIEIPDSLVEKFGPETCKTREIVPTPFKVFINPVMQVKDFKKTLFPEACESLKGISAIVPRYRAVHVKGYEYDGSPTEWDATGWAARIVQHEMDHLDGQIYTDIMESKSLQVDLWKKINVHQGKILIKYNK